MSDVNQSNDLDMSNSKFFYSTSFDLDDQNFSNPFIPSDTEEAPPIPERPDEESIPKAYTLGYDDLLMDDNLEYGDQSYIHDDVMRHPPPVPSPLSPSVRKDLLDEKESPAVENEEPVIDLPPEFVEVDPSFKEGSLDELIGLAPEKQEKNNMKSLLNKVKGQTTNVFNRFLRLSSIDKSADLLGIEEMTEEEPAATTDPFTAYEEPFEVSNENTNADVDDLFGLMSLENEEGGADPTHIAEESDRKKLFKTEADHYSLCLAIMALSKIVSPEEFNLIKQEGSHDQSKTLRILRNYLEKGIDTEFNKMVHRSSYALPPEERKLKVIKESDGSRYEVKRINTITFSVPKIFVFNDCFFFLAEMRNSRMNLINQWSPCIVQITRYQLRVYGNLADIAQENTSIRVNLHKLMMLSNVQSKPYKQSMYYYVKLFENDLWNHRVIESKPLKFRNDLSSIQVLKLGSKEEIVLRTLAYQLQLRIKSIHNQEEVEF